MWDLAHLKMNTTVLVLWRELKYLRCRMSISLEQNHLNVYTVSGREKVYL